MAVALEPDLKPGHEADHDPMVSDWLRQGGYFLPDETDAAAAKPDIKHKYRPPMSDVWGVLVACTVIGVWGLLFWHAMFHVRLPWDVPEQASSHASFGNGPVCSVNLVLNSTISSLPGNCSATATLPQPPPLTTSSPSQSEASTSQPETAVTPSSWLHVIVLFFALEFLYTGGCCSCAVLQLRI